MNTFLAIMKFIFNFTKLDATALRLKKKCDAQMNLQTTNYFDKFIKNTKRRVGTAN